MELSRRDVVAGGVASIGLGLTGCSRTLLSAQSNRDIVWSSARETLQGQGPPDPNKTSEVNEIGCGLDSAFGEIMGMVVLGTLEDQNVVTPEAYRPNTLQYSLTENQSEYNSVIGRRARARGSYGPFSGSARGGSLTTKSNNSYSLHVVAIARRYNPMRVLTARSASLNPELARLVRRNRRSAQGRRELLRTLGDSYLAAVVSGSEILIDIAFETSSESTRRQLKGEIRGAVAGIGSGSAGYSQLIGSARSHKSVTARIVGLAAGDVPQEFNALEVHDILERFFADGSRQSAITFVNAKPLRTLIFDGSPLELASERELDGRLEYVNYVNDAFVLLDDTLTDTEYVMANTNEFESATLDRARADRERVSQAREQLVQMSRQARSLFRDSGEWDAAATPRIAALVPEDLRPYQQKEPAPVPQPAPQPRRRPRVNRERTHDGPICGGGCSR